MSKSTQVDSCAEASKVIGMAASHFENMEDMPGDERALHFASALMGAKWAFEVMNLNSAARDVAAFARAMQQAVAEDAS